ncbi:hypothetical protein BKA69DRAFT_1065254 [Paraphysoderma sedebokerense]|nr:hypothetical protein BKA69DRAFT_1065121 [Paraphysoderma sedebokerense]KAI9142893.1 hypothetical protein BKA69DRAFT_1065254 [Paraphysoderma sedebokerense]
MINRRPDSYYIRDDDEEEQIRKMVECAAITAEDVQKEKNIVWERCIKEHKIIKGFHRSSKQKTN